MRPHGDGASNARGCTRCTPAYDHPYLHGDYGDRLRHMSYFLGRSSVRPTPTGGCQLVPSHFSDMPRLLRRTTPSARRARGRPRRRTATATSRSARTPTTSAPFIGRGAVLPRGRTRTCRGPSARTTSTSARSSAGASRPARCSRCPPPRSTDLDRRDRRARRRAHPRRRHHPGRHRRRSPTRCSACSPTTATSASTPSCCPTASIDLDRVGRRHRSRARPLDRGKVVDHVRAGHRSGSTTSSHDNPAVELLPVDWVNDPRVIGREQRFVSINADPRGRPARPVRLGDRSTGATGRAAAARPTSPAVPCTRRTGRASSCCTRPPGTATVAHRRPRSPGRGRDHR